MLIELIIVKLIPEQPSCGTCRNRDGREYDIIFCGEKEIPDISWGETAKNCKKYKHQ